MIAVWKKENRDKTRNGSRKFERTVLINQSMLTLPSLFYESSELKILPRSSIYYQFFFYLCCQFVRKMKKTTECRRLLSHLTRTQGKARPWHIRFRLWRASQVAKLNGNVTLDFRLFVCFLFYIFALYGYVPCRNFCKKKETMPKTKIDPKTKIEKQNV